MVDNVKLPWRKMEDIVDLIVVMNKLTIRPWYQQAIFV
jgi:hypothetical protein